MPPEPAVAPPAGGSDEETLAALRAGDERAFRDLFERNYPMMKRVARAYVDSDAVAEEIVQETWMAIVTGIDRFEGRSALGTWIFSILTNQAKTHSTRERRAVPLSSVARATPRGRWSIPTAFRRTMTHGRGIGRRRRARGRSLSADCCRSRHASSSSRRWPSCPSASG